MGRELNILVVDDEQIVLDSIKKHLKKENCVVHGTLTAQDGLDRLAEIEVDIVLTDLMMPEIDGLELMKLIKARYPDMPVIMITGYATINSALQATQLGAFDYVAKPFSKTELLRVIERAADFIRKKVGAIEKQPDVSEGVTRGNAYYRNLIRTIGDQSWLYVQNDGSVTLGVERSFLHTVGGIQTVFLPSKGDSLRQGNVYFQVFSTDLRTHAVESPLSGSVVDVNERVMTNPEFLIQDPYGEGWLVKLKPSDFDKEIQQVRK
ncbi:MAG: response regulator [Candidatus Zixiibacteriota bacterium]|nr:MAG: response regulator [candidate division Zixibacteria bacterium]